MTRPGAELLFTLVDGLFRWLSKAAAGILLSEPVAVDLKH